MRLDRPVSPARAPRIERVDARPIGIFDSGAGGLTVLHECLVTLPHEDFLYLGDGARCPYGPRPQDGDPPVRARDRVLSRAAGREADRRGLQRGHLGGAPYAAGGAESADRRRARARGARGSAGDPEPAHRPPRHPGHGCERPVRGDRPRARRGSARRLGRLPEARSADRGGRRRRGARRRGARVRSAAQGGGRRHRHPRLHPLSDDQARLRAGLRPRDDAGLLRGRDRARGGRDAGAQGRRERPGPATAPPASSRRAPPTSSGRSVERFLQLPIPRVEQVTVRELELATT